jgi:hypothetical protein
MARLSEERGRRVTGQDGLAEALLDYFIKHGATPPPELVEAAKDAGAEIPPEPPRKSRKAPHLSSVKTAPRS